MQLTTTAIIEALKKLRQQLPIITTITWALNSSSNNETKTTAATIMCSMTANGALNGSQHGIIIDNIIITIGTVQV
jgi:hypothetical protein